MKRCDPKKSAAAVVLASQGNKQGFHDLFSLYFRDVYYICSVVAGVTYELSETVQEVFLRLWRDIGAITPDNFEDLLFTLSVSISANAAKKQGGADKELAAYDEVKNVPSFEIIKESFDSFTPVQGKPEAKALGFFGEMIGSLPQKNREILMLAAFTSLNSADIGSAIGKEADYVENNLRETYSFLIHQAKRAGAIGFDFVKYIPRMPQVIGALADSAVTPSGMWAPVAKAVGYEDRFEPSEPEQQSGAPIRKIPKQKKTLRPGTKRALMISAAVVIIAAVICAGAFLLKNSGDGGVSVSQNGVSHSDGAPSWDGSAAAEFESGAGTRENPYIIASPGQLRLLSDLVNAGNMEYFACYYALGADIDLENVDFKPIGYRNSRDDYKYFCGEFDGRGHTVSGLYISGGDCGALFGYARDAVIKNLKIDGCRITGGKYCAGAVGYFTSQSKNTGVFGCRVAGIISAEAYAGGVIGYAETDGQSASFSAFGCSSSGSVAASGQTAGGIIGYLQTNDGASGVSDCINYAVISSADNAGGIVGANQVLGGSAVIKTSVNTGKITCDKATRGSIAGLNDSFSAESRARVENCLYLISTCDKDVNSGENSYVNAAGLSEEQLSQEINFDGFDIENVWNISGSLPALRNRVWNSKQEEMTQN